MPSFVTTATTARVRVVDIPLHKKLKVSAFEVLNASTHVVNATLQRVFAPSVSAAVANPQSHTTESVSVLRAAASASEKLGRDDMEDIRAFGRLQVFCDGVVATCNIAVRYNFE